MKRYTYAHEKAAFALARKADRLSAYKDNNGTYWVCTGFIMFASRDIDELIKLGLIDATGAILPDKEMSKSAYDGLVGGKYDACALSDTGLAHAHTVKDGKKSTCKFARILSVADHHITCVDNDLFAPFLDGAHTQKKANSVIYCYTSACLDVFVGVVMPLCTGDELKRALANTLACAE